MAAAARAATAPAIRPLRLELVDLTLAGVAVVTVVIADDDFSEVVMYEGEPFLRDQRIGPLTYRQARPVHAIGA
jgi:hypothetical protein